MNAEQSACPAYILPGDPPDLKPDPLALEAGVEAGKAGGSRWCPLPTCSDGGDIAPDLKPDATLLKIKDEQQDPLAPSSYDPAEDELAADPPDAKLRLSEAVDVKEETPDAVSASSSTEGEDPLVLRCLLCDRMWLGRDALDTHFRKCHGYVGRNDRYYKCDWCEYYTDDAANFVCHRRTHTGDRPHRCDVCGKVYTTSSSLVVHRRIHTGEKKSYRCDDCGKTFTRSGSLNVHRRKHTGDRPFRCDDCGKTFTRSSHLVVHRRIHSGERPYRCDVCGRAFTQPANMKSHRRIHAGEKMRQCELCGALFNKYGYSRHMKTHNTLPSF